MPRTVVSSRSAEMDLEALPSGVAPPPPAGPAERGRLGRARRSTTLKPDAYTDRLIKYIPAEVITLYLTSQALLRSAGGSHPVLSWGTFGFGVAATALYLWRVLKVTRPRQLVISTLAFAVWAFALGGPFASLSWYQPLHGALLLCTYTFLVPIVEA